ncbi:hypothetical protein EFS61_02650 [Lactobacillus hominis]|nr:hypothetical protein [Lactobacillus hominis]
MQFLHRSFFVCLLVFDERMLKMLRFTNSDKKITADMKLVCRIAQEEKFATLQRLKTSTSGLPSKEASQRLQAHGNNEITIKKGNQTFHLLIESLLTPFVFVLLAISVISFFTNYLFVTSQKDLSITAIALTLAVLVTLMNFVQKMRTNSEIETLLDRTDHKISVRRDDEKQVLATQNLVDGDLVYLKAGDVVPADMRLIETNNLYCSSSSLTGQAKPVSKNAFKKPNVQINDHYLDYPNIAFQGTSVVAGTGVGIVFARGNRSAFGRLAQDVSKNEIKQSVLDIGIKDIVKILLMTSIFILPFVLLVSDITRGSLINAIIFALAATIGIVPEILSSKVTNNIVKGALDRASMKRLFEAAKN